MMKRGQMHFSSLYGSIERAHARRMEFCSTESQITRVFVAFRPRFGKTLPLLSEAWNSL
jgi:hypothetical protein